MYLMLGTIALEAIDVTDFSENQTARFAEHQVILGKPRLQALAEDLTSFNLSIRLHHKIGGVERRYQALIAAKAKQEALALIWGRGKFKGNFVITDIHSNTLFTDKYGAVLCRELSLSLKEYVGELYNDPLGMALNKGAGTLIGAMIPPNLLTGVNDAKEALNKGIALYHQGRRSFEQIQHISAIMQQFAQDPTVALSYIPETLNHLDEAIDAFSMISAQRNKFTPLREALPVIRDWTDEINEVLQNLTALQTDFKQGLQGNKETNWFPSVGRTINETADSLDYLSPKTAEMTAWVVLRNDEEAIYATDRT